MKPYHSFRTPVFAAILFCIIGTSCQKDLAKTNAEGKNSTTSKNSVLVQPPEFKQLLYVPATQTDMSTYPCRELHAITWTINGNEAYGRGLLWFHNIPELANGATIPPTSAYLTLYSHLNPLNGDHMHANAGVNNTMVIRRIASSWDVLTTQWFNQPDFSTDHEVIIPHTNNSYEDLINIDVTALVQDMFYYGNYGFMILLDTESSLNSRIFYSDQDSPNLAPQLTLTF